MNLLADLVEHDMHLSNGNKSQIFWPLADLF